MKLPNCLIKLNYFLIYDFQPRLNQFTASYFRSQGWTKLNFRHFKSFLIPAVMQLKTISATLMKLAKCCLEITVWRLWLKCHSDFGIGVFFFCMSTIKIRNNCVLGITITPDLLGFSCPAFKSRDKSKLYNTEKRNLQSEAGLWWEMLFIFLMRGYGEW